MEKAGHTLKRVMETMVRYGMTDPGETVITAVSGGPDSVCLLHILNELAAQLEISLVAAHYNHGLRKAEDEFETRLTREMAETMGIPFETEKSPFLRNAGASIEEKARDARYAFLERVREKYRAGKIAMGHHMNDQAETVLMRLLRGSGPSGLSGIPPVRNKKIIRPLLGIKRDEIMNYIATHKLPYAVDSSNADTRYLRNSVRLELLPLLQDYQPRIIEHLDRLSGILRGEDDFLEKQAATWVEKEAEKDANGDITVPVSSMKRLHASFRNRVIRRLLKNRVNNLRRIDSSHIQSVSGLVRSRKPQAVLRLPGGITVSKIYNRIVFSLGLKQPVEAYEYTVHGPGTIYLEAIDRTMRFEEMDGGMSVGPGNPETTACLDADKLRYPLIIRNFRPGDKFVPLGMKGHRKIKDFFIDLKIPSGTRAITPLVTGQDRILWVAGYRIDDRYKVTGKTIKILKITIV